MHYLFVKKILQCFQECLAKITCKCPNNKHSVFKFQIDFVLIKNYAPDCTGNKIEIYNTKLKRNKMQDSFGSCLTYKNLTLNKNVFGNYKN